MFIAWRKIYDEVEKQLLSLQGTLKSEGRMNHIRKIRVCGIIDGFM